MARHARKDQRWYQDCYGWENYLRSPTDDPQQSDNGVFRVICHTVHLAESDACKMRCGEAYGRRIRIIYLFTIEHSKKGEVDHSCSGSDS